MRSIDISAATSDLDARVQAARTELQRLEAAQEVIKTIPNIALVLEVLQEVGKHKGNGAAPLEPFPADASLIDRIAHFITHAPQPVNTEEIAKALHTGSVSGIRATVYKLVNAKRIKKMSVGLFWKPEASKSAERAAAKANGTPKKKLNQNEAAEALTEMARSFLKTHKDAIGPKELTEALEAAGAPFAGRDHQAAVVRALRVNLKKEVKQSGWARSVQYRYKG